MKLEEATTDWTAARAYEAIWDTAREAAQAAWEKVWDIERAAENARATAKVAEAEARAAKATWEKETRDN